MDSKKSIYWIDNLKFIGILLVIIGHNDTRLTTYIYSFHMPLFFLMSGIVFNKEKWGAGTFKDFIKNRANSLLLPYFVLAMILYIIWIPMAVLQEMPLTKEVLIKNFIGIFYVNGAHEFMTWGVPMWFLPCLFLVNIIFYVIYNKFKSYTPLVLIIMSVVGYCLGFVPLKMPWSIDVAVTSVFFYGVGFLLKDIIYRYEVSIKKLPILIILIIISFILSKLNGRVDLYSKVYNNYFFFYGAAIFGSIYMVLLVKLLPKNNIFTFIGKNTLPILAFHIVAVQVIKSILTILLKINTSFSSIPMGAIILPVAQIILLIPMIYLSNSIIKYIRKKLK